MNKKYSQRFCTLIAIGGFLPLMLPAPALADGAAAGSIDAVRADELFQQGKDRLAQLDYAHACPLLAQSVALDPASGSWLALAICREREGKLASAQAAYKAAAERSRQENRPERLQAAEQRLKDLDGKLSTLTLETAEQARGFELHVNGVLLEPAQLGKPLAVDGGPQLIEASAPGRKPWQQNITVADSRGERHVVVPELEATAPEALAPVPAKAASTARRPARSTARARSGKHRLNATQWAGLGTIGAGLIGAAAGGVLVLHAVGKDKDSDAGCIGNLCTVEARRDRLYARDAGNAATLAFIAGGALLTAGLVLYIAGGQATEETPPEHARLSTHAWIAPHAAGAGLHGAF